jgi:hypothetical protein
MTVAGLRSYGTRRKRCRAGCMRISPSRRPSPWRPTKTLSQPFDRRRGPVIGLSGGRVIQTSRCKAPVGPSMARTCHCRLARSSAPDHRLIPSSRRRRPAPDRRRSDRTSGPMARNDRPWSPPPPRNAADRWLMTLLHMGAAAVAAAVINHRCRTRLE